MKNILFAFLLLSAFHVYPVNAANLDTSLKFSTIETSHFSVHFHQGLDEVALKAATFAEGIHSSLVKEFEWEPLEKTQIVLIDDTDFTNAYASVLPYNTMYIQLVPPSMDTTLGEYDDWLEMIIIHEYTHILTMDAARGYSGLMRKFFGKPVPALNPFSFLAFLATAPPNVFLPSWWLEGAATWGETEFTKMGRGRSTFYEMILRMAVAENSVPTIDRINGELPSWPGGHLPYIFGLRLQKYISDKYGKDAPGKMSISHAGRAPFFINGAALQLFGKDYESLYNEMVRDLQRNESYRIETLTQLPFTPLKTLGAEGEILTRPRYSPDGRQIAFNRKDPHQHESIVITERDGSGLREIVRRRPSDGTICWYPDGSGIYFTQAEIESGFNVYQDLYSFDLKRKDLKRITNSLRIKEPDIAPDGERFAVITSEGGNQNLAILEPFADNVKMTQLTKYKLMRISNPRWSSDGKYILYSSADNNSATGIHIYSLAEETDKLLFKNGNSNAYPTWSPDGKHIVYVSDETGVYNIHAFSLKDNRSYQVTHILGGAFHPDVSPEGAELLLSSYHSGGFNIAAIEYSDQKWVDEHSPAITPYWNEGNVKSSFYGRTNETGRKNHGAQDSSTGKTSPDLKVEVDQTAGTKQPYSVWDTLPPKFWLPTLYGDHEGTVAGVFTAGRDVIGYNTFMAQIDKGLSSGNGYYDITYLNDYLYPSFMLNIYARPLLYSGLTGNRDYYEMDRSAVMSMTLPVNRLESNYRFTLGYHIRKQDVLNKEVLQNVGSNRLFQGKRNNVFAAFEFSNTLKYPYSISYEEGSRINLEHRYYSGETGSDINSKEYIASYTGYFTAMPKYLRHHVVYLRLSGALSEGERTLQQAFQLGGYPQQSEFPLRGYASRFATGKYIATGSLEYRLPLSYILKGAGTKPFFWNKLHGAIFVDTGEVWDDSRGFSAGRLKTGAGMEARLDMTLGYRLDITPAIGIARGFDQGGETSAYLTIYFDL